MFSFSEVTTTDVLKLIKRININKAMGKDQTLPKLIQTASNFLVEPLTDIINPCFSTSNFPDLAKWASITPIDEGGIAYTIYRPVSVLNTFSKIIKSSILDQLSKHVNECL